MNRKHIFQLLSLAVIVAVTIAFAACKKYREFKDVILITGTETDNQIKFTVENLPSSINVTASATGIVTQDITVNFAVDTSLVSTYNAQVSGNYFAAPAGSYTVSATSGVIKKGA